MGMWNIPSLMHLRGEIKSTPVPVITGTLPSHAGWIMSSSTWWDVIYDAMPVPYRVGNLITRTILRMYGFSQSTNRFSGMLDVVTPACLRLDPQERVSVSFPVQLEWKYTLAIRSYDWPEWFANCVWACSCITVCMQNRTFSSFFLTKTWVTFTFTQVCCGAGLSCGAGKCFDFKVTLWRRNLQFVGYEREAILLVEFGASSNVGCNNGRNIII